MLRRQIIGRDAARLNGLANVLRGLLSVSRMQRE
jgi:hypothetical protein